MRALIATAACAPAIGLAKDQNACPLQTAVKVQHTQGERQPACNPDDADLDITAACAPAVALAEDQNACLLQAAVKVQDTQEERQLACNPDDSDLDIVVSTGCTAFQNWQAEVLLNSALHVGQCGRITRIVVGCDMEDGLRETYATHPTGGAARITRLEELQRSSHPNVTLHIAPAIKEAKEFPWYNKPWSFYHWLQSKPDLGRAVAILDPDEFFMQPLTQRGGVLDGARVADTTKTRLLRSDPSLDITDVVQPGMAVAQRYGFGTTFLSMFDKNTICPGGSASPCAKLTQRDGERYYPAGPPYILHRDDFQKVMPTWWDLMTPVYQRDKGDIQADMYAYVYAAAHNNVRHALFDNYMLSNVDAFGEAWKWVDSLEEMSCLEPSIPNGHPRPGFLHAATHYKACTTADPTTYMMEDCPAGGQLWNFHKGHVPGEILDCSHPLLQPPPDNLFNENANAKNVRGKRGAFMVCNFISMINRAALEYKQKYCPAGFMQKKCTRIVTGAAGRAQSFNASNPWHYPLARVDADCCPECRQ